MTTWTFIRQNLGFYWRTHLGVILGTALGAMVLTGSLLVGDSVKATLSHQAELRVGRVESIVTSGDKLFREKLAEECGAAPVLLLRGSVTTPDGSGRVNQAQVLGVDERFWKLAPASHVPAELGEPTAWVNERLASQLSLKAGDTLIVRVEKPTLFSRDAPLSGDEEQVVALRVKVAATLSAEQFGRFNLQASQVPPFTVFVPLHFLQERLAMQGRANLLLAAKGVDLREAVRRNWTLDDAGLIARATGHAEESEVRAGHVFLERSVIEAAPKGGVDVLTYLVNEIRAGEKATPYSMVTAIDAAGSRFLPAELADDEITINRWLADDLGVKEGDPVTLKYFVMGDRRQLEERSQSFNVFSILPMDEARSNFFLRRKSARCLRARFREWSSRCWPCGWPVAGNFVSARGNSWAGFPRARRRGEGGASP